MELKMFVRLVRLLYIAYVSYFLWTIMVSRRSLNLILTCLISVCDVVGCLWHHILGNHRLTNSKRIWNACLTSYDKKPLGHSKCINFSCLNYNELSLSTHIQETVLYLRTLYSYVVGLTHSISHRNHRVQWGCWGNWYHSYSCSSRSS